VRQRARLALLAIVAAFAAAAAGPSLACSCMPRTEAEIIDSADVVVAGKVMEVRQIGPVGSGTRLASIEVSRIVKGRVHRQIQIRTPDTSAACGLDMPLGAVMRIAARKLHDGLHTNLCMSLRGPQTRG
jgi:hypothetical protein